MIITPHCDISFFYAEVNIVFNIGVNIFYILSTFLINLFKKNNNLKSFGKKVKRRKN